MSSYVPCAVAGCDDRKSSRHRFPNPEKNNNRFDTWISLIANLKLVNLQPLEVYRNYRVYHQHFTMDDKSSNMYLKRTAVPSQKLPINAAVLSEMQPNIIGTPSTSTFGSDIRKKVCINSIITGKKSDVSDKSCALYKQALEIQRKRKNVKAK
ncbi:hypothetical protein FQA39_LY15632 [Lamprigera yunnana]|nr:hypothetical protein FQA39_LY15632 [Lamprigera yunnana]